MGQTTRVQGGTAEQRVGQYEYEMGSWRDYHAGDDVPACVRVIRHGPGGRANALLGRRTEPEGVALAARVLAGEAELADLVAWIDAPHPEWRSPIWQPGSGVVIG